MDVTADPLYQHIFRWVATIWTTYRHIAPSTLVVLVAEWSNSRDSFVSGEIIRTWRYTTQELESIPIGAYQQQRAAHPHPNPRSLIYLDFHVFADRKKVVLGEHVGFLAGSGQRYNVQYTEAGIAFTPDSSGGQWIS